MYISVQFFSAVLYVKIKCTCKYTTELTEVVQRFMEKLPSYKAQILNRTS